MRSLLTYPLALFLAVAPMLEAAEISAPIAQAAKTSTPIRHLVVIFQENVSFDHYFGTYPYALNPPNQPRFVPAPNTPSVNGFSETMLNHNPNLNPANGPGATNPFRLDRSQAATADQDHDYMPEQMAVHGGLMDLFPASVGTAGPPPPGTPIAQTTGLTMGYYDGNTVTAMWTYAQNFALNDNSFGSTFGPSTPGAINLISGQTNGIIDVVNGPADSVDGGNGSMTLIGDSDPIGDVCSSSTGSQVTLIGPNVGDLLNHAGVSWGFFEGGFNLKLVNANGSTGCSRSSTSPITNVQKNDYVAHHQPFQYYKSTANPNHVRPTALALIGKRGDAANHQYDSEDFFAAVQSGNFPEVSFLKAPAYEDGHAGYSDPLDEQQFIVKTINFLQTRPEWKDTAVIIAYDDSDGWYDHQMGPIVNQSTSSADALTTVGSCGDGSIALPGPLGNPHAQGRCGYGPRLPLLVISPWAKHNFVDHTVTDQTSILRFIEDNWVNGNRIGHGSFDGIANSIMNMFDFTQTPPPSTLILDEAAGTVVTNR